MTGPLAGVRVLDLTRLLPGGYATLLLADLGADVVKVEEPESGDYIRWMAPMAGEHSAGHVALNRNKRSITINLRSNRGRDLLIGLAAHFDVLVESFRPGVLDRLGVGWGVLHDRHPRLIYCAITGYGQDGPRAAEAGHDINYIGYGGVLGITGEENGRPVVPGVQIGDLAGGGMQAVIAVLTALYERAQTGAGSFCDVAMLDGVVSWLTLHAAAFAATGEVPERGTMPLSGGFPCYRVYPAADGYLSVGALEPKFWSALCDALGRDDFVGDAYATGERGTRVIAELEDLFRRQTRAQWMKTFEGLDVCVAPVNDLAEALADEQVRHRAMAVDADVGGRPWIHIGAAIRPGPSPTPLVRRPPPGLGEHTAEILAEAGVGHDELEVLRASGVV